MEEKQTTSRMDLILLLILIIIFNFVSYYTKKELANPIFIIINIICAIFEFNMIFNLKLKKKLKIITLACATFILIASLCYLYNFFSMIQYQIIPHYDSFVSVEEAIFQYRHIKIINYVYEINKISLLLTILLNGFLVYYKPKYEKIEFSKNRLNFLKIFKPISLVLMSIVVFITFYINYSKKIKIELPIKDDESYLIYSTYHNFDDKEPIYSLSIFSWSLDSYPENADFTDEKTIKTYIINELYKEASLDLRYYRSKEKGLEDIEIIEGKVENMKKGDIVIFKFKGDIYNSCLENGVVFKNNLFKVKAGEYF